MSQQCLEPEDLIPVDTEYLITAAEEELLVEDAPPPNAAPNAALISPTPVNNANPSGKSNKQVPIINPYAKSKPSTSTTTQLEGRPPSTSKQGMANMARAKSTIQGRSNGIVWWNMFARLHGYEPFEKITAAHVANDNLEDMLNAFITWIANNPLPKNGFDEDLQPSTEAKAIWFGQV